MEFFRRFREESSRKRGKNQGKETRATHDDGDGRRTLDERATEDDDVIGDERDASTNASPGGARGGGATNNDRERFFENLIVAESERERIRRGPERTAESSVPVERSDESE